MLAGAEPSQPCGRAARRGGGEGGLVGVEGRRRHHLGGRRPLAVEVGAGARRDALVAAAAGREDATERVPELLVEDGVDDGVEGGVGVAQPGQHLPTRDPPAQLSGNHGSRGPFATTL